MKSYRRLQFGIFALILLYTAVSYTTTRVRGVELFPFFNWSLFTNVPNEKHDFGLRLLSVDGEMLNPPLYFEEADVWFAESHSIVAYKTIQGFGNDIRKNNEMSVAETRPFIESFYLEGKAVEYEVVRRTYHPVERFRSGSFVDETALTQFPSGDEQ